MIGSYAFKLAVFVLYEPLRMISIKTRNKFFVDSLFRFACVSLCKGQYGAFQRSVDIPRDACKFTACMSKSSARSGYALEKSSRMARPVPQQFSSSSPPLSVPLIRFLIMGDRK